MAGDLLRLKSDAVGWRLVEDQVVALELRDNQYFAVNRSGARLWMRLADGASRDDLVATLVDEYDVDAETAARDVDDFVAALDERELLETA